MRIRNGVTRAGNVLALLWTAVSALSCGDALSPLSTAESPQELTVHAVAVGAVRLTWKPVQGSSIVGYQVQRRADQQGEFVTLPGTVPQAPELATYLDTDVKPETFYGYRVVTVTSFGDRSTPSVASGTRTPPPPGIIVTTESESPNAASQDPDGYRVLLTGRDTVSAVMGLAAQHRFAPLRPGTYRAVLQGVVSRCDVDNDSVRTVVVSDTGVNTLTPVSYRVRCRDQNRARIVAIVTALGDSAAKNGFQLRGSGVTSAPEPVGLKASVPSAGGASKFDNLLPGDYEIELYALEAHCINPGSSKVRVVAKAAVTDTVRFAVVCETRRPDQTTRPLAWRNAWSVAAAAPQQKVFLTVTLDAGSRAQLKVAAVQGELRYDEKVLRFEKAEASPEGGLTGVTANGTTAGLVAFGSIDNEGVGKAGLIPVARMEFTVIGAVGASAITRTRITEVTTPDVKSYEDSTRVVEDTLLVGASDAGKQPPVAMANGPYAGSVGNAIAFSSAGSNDPDGGTVTYKWSFGDGSAESTLASPAKSYSTAGIYTVTLLVTDDEGSSTSAQTTATITAAGAPAAKPLVWSNSWATASAAPLEKVLLTIAVDASARGSVKLAAAQSELRYDATVLRFEKAQAVPVNGLSGVTANGTAPGFVAIGSLDNNGVGLSGVVGVAQVEFTVIGATGSRAITQTKLTEITAPDLTEYVDSTSVVEDTLAIGSVSAPVKQPPVASANGPYTGTVGGAIAFSSAGSNDPDGGAVTYKWNFGDGSPESTIASPAKSYVAAGAFTVTLTVTDDEGATATVQTTASITAPATPAPPVKQPPVAIANGPYSAIVGATVNFSSAGSNDPDGGAVTYKWNFGDGSSESMSASPSKSYGAAGTYPVVLTITDDEGVSTTAQTTATVTAPASGTSKPLIWENLFSDEIFADSTIVMTVSYDLRENIPETPPTEALQSWIVDSLKWNPAVLKFVSFTFGRGGAGSVNETNAATGTLTFRGTPAPTINSGLLTIATIRFKVVGQRGLVSTTQTWLGPLVGPASYPYNAKTALKEATFVVP